MSPDAVQTPRLVQLLDCDGLGGIEAPLVDPRLYPVDVDGRHFHLERIVLPPPPLGLRNRQGRLSTLEARRHLSVRMLALLPSSSRLALARCRATTAADLLAICALVVRQR